MFPQSEPPVVVNIQVDDNYVKKRTDERIDELFERFLRPQWLTIADMEKITRHKRAWIMEFVVDDPYVRRNKLAKKEEGKNGKWLFDADKIRPFLDKLFHDLPDY
ncbi:DUF771 domain-containing protein [Enterococcus sp. DIV1420a]|uniref:DUF771 domain-containing protein n=1 Tax=Enterococcus sp. DIV1420a TaxID=2774672 RepID=UPI003F296823